MSDTPVEDRFTLGFAMRDLRSLTDTQLNQLSPEGTKARLKQLVPFGLVSLGNDEIDGLTPDEASTMLADARHDAQVRVN